MAHPRELVWRCGGKLMCGICGFLSHGSPEPESLLLAMNAQITRRGPDGEGHFHDGRVGIAMRRLAIIDLHGGQQPIFNESGSCAIVFNGEIYNYRALRAGLLQKGHVFRTESDTEVILHLYEEYAEDAPRHLEGMFAFAIWDAARQSVFLSRDRLGIKPLYLARLDGATFFGSEIKSLLATGKVPGTLDLQGLDEFFTYTNIPTPRTAYASIEQLPPGMSARISIDGSLSYHRYWSVPKGPVRRLSEEQWISNCEQALQRSVESHMVSDVPVGAFLSGGVDSGLLVAMMASTGARRIPAFTVGFDDAGTAFIDEREFARDLARKYSLEHHEVNVTAKAEDILWEIVDAFDQPFADDSVIPSYYVSKFAAEHVKVAMTGLGGDELFGGYRRHLGMLLGGWYAKLPGILTKGALDPLIRMLPESRNSNDFVDHLKRFSRAASATAADRYQDYLSTLPWQSRSDLYSPQFASAVDERKTAQVVSQPFHDGAGETLLRRVLATDLQRYLVDDVLTLSDRLSMWHSLELRVPYLDHRFVELCSEVPDRLKIRGSTQKYLLKKIAERWLPRRMIYHKKQGFEAPMGRWLRGPLLPLFDSIVNRRSLERHGILNHEEVARLRDEHVRGIRKNSKILFSILMFCAWMERRQGRA